MIKKMQGPSLAGTWEARIFKLTSAILEQSSLHFQECRSLMDPHYLVPHCSLGPIIYFWYIRNRRGVPGSRCPQGVYKRGNTRLYYTILYYTILYYTILYYTILYYTILYYTILYYIILYYTILYYTILYYTILYYTILYYTILYYTMLN